MIGINSTVSSLLWFFAATSPFYPVIFQSDQPSYPRGGNVTMTATFSFEQNFASLTFWDSEQFLNYTANETTTALNASFTNTFPVYTIPANYSDPTITTRLWWDNGTAAGIAIINIPIAVNATFQSLSPFGEMKENTNATFGFTYYNNQNQSIPNAQVNVKGWISNNWSVQYINNIYEVNLFAYNLTPWISKFNHLRE